MAQWTKVPEFDTRAHTVQEKNCSSKFSSDLHRQPVAWTYMYAHKINVIYLQKYVIKELEVS